MRKILKFTIFLFISTVLTLSCSSDDNSGGSSMGTFTLDGETYKVNMATIQSINNLDAPTTNSSITLSGTKGSETVSITFSVLHNTEVGIGGDYVSDENSWDEIIGTYSSWLSSYSILTESGMNSTNQPIGPVKIIEHGNNQYTLEFDVKYSNNVTASASVKTKFTVQVIEF